MKKTAIIIGAGPAGITAAYEFVKHTNIKPIIFDFASEIGGISKTVNYKGNRIDIGGHRFFSKSDRIMKWWQNILPIQNPDEKQHSNTLLIRNRLSRIFFNRKFFNYPLVINIDTIYNLGFKRIFKIGCSYLKVRISPIKKEVSLEDFFINRFGKELYSTFFKDYTEKVWGISCSRIKAEWGAQRIKEFSLLISIKHAIKKSLSKGTSLNQKNTQTTLVEKFLYPKFGPGQMWETVAEIIKENGGEIYLKHKVVGLSIDFNQAIEIEVLDLDEKKIKRIKGDYFLSSAPIKDLVSFLKNQIPPEVKVVAEGLPYRDFIIVGLLMEKLKIKSTRKNKSNTGLIPDNWIYIQEPDVKLGRLQIFNNWSPYMVKDEDKVWIGLEYFCNEGDELWKMTDQELTSYAINELAKIGIIEKSDVRDSTLIRMQKAYPAYFGSYDQFQTIRDYFDKVENLFLIGRNGMHKYNNQDHSMMTAIVSVENIKNGITSKENVWLVNTEQEYHETSQ